MEKYVAGTIRQAAIRNKTWFARLNNTAPIAVVLVVSVVLAGIAINNHCSTGCFLF